MTNSTTTNSYINSFVCFNLTTQQRYLPHESAFPVSAGTTTTMGFLLTVAHQQLHGKLELAPAFLYIARRGHFRVNTRKAGASLFWL